MLTIQFKTTRLTVTEANAAKYRAIIDSGKLPKIKMPSSTPIRRDYPAFWPGMTTADYVAAFNRQFDGVQIKIQHDCPRYHLAAPMLDATQPEVLEEIDPDYVEQPRTVKVSGRATAAQLRKACQAAVDLLTDPNADADSVGQAAAMLREVLQ